MKKTLQILGTPATQEIARLRLENQPQIKRLDLRADGTVTLVIQGAFNEKNLIPLLATSGISGFRYF